MFDNINPENLLVEDDVDGSSPETRKPATAGTTTESDCNVPDEKLQEDVLTGFRSCLKSLSLGTDDEIFDENGGVEESMKILSDSCRNEIGVSCPKKVENFCKKAVLTEMSRKDRLGENGKYFHNFMESCSGLFGDNSETIDSIRGRMTSVDASAHQEQESTLELTSCNSLYANGKMFEGNNFIGINGELIPLTEGGGGPENKSYKITFADGTSGVHQSKLQDLYDNVLGCAKTAWGFKLINEHFDKTKNNTPKISSKIFPQMVCRGSGAITKDYVACKKVLHTLDSYSFAEQGLQTYQQGDQAVHHAKVQSEIVKNFHGGDNLQPYLGAQAKTIDKRKEQEMQKGALTSAQLAQLVAKIRSFPTSEKALALCDNDTSNKQYWIEVNKKFETVAPDIVRSPVSDRENSPCRAALYSERGKHLFRNEGILQDAKAKRNESVMKLGQSAVQSHLLGEHADDIRKRIAELKKRREDALKGDGFDEDLLVDQCQLNPHLEACRGKDGSPGPFGFTPGGYVFGGGGNPGSLTPKGGENPFKPENPSGHLPSEDIIIPEGLSELEERLGGGVEGRPSGQRAKLSGASGGGGGGAPPGGGGGGGGQGGVSAADFEKKGGGPGFNGSRDVIGPGYRGGALFGRGRGSGKGKGGSNLSSLLGKKSKNKDRNSMLSYRLPASVSQRGTNIFKRISARYDKVEKSKRLLEYEVK
ncbi:MAG: hypothetical protein OXB88_01725 [Bacteriovoracales bacterium]|nr:hypothetical protein [Bacteriovoracales bacterium]